MAYWRRDSFVIRDHERIKDGATNLKVGGQCLLSLPRTVALNIKLNATVLTRPEVILPITSVHAHIPSPFFSGIPSTNSILFDVCCSLHLVHVFDFTLHAFIILIDCSLHSRLYITFVSVHIIRVCTYLPFPVILFCFLRLLSFIANKVLSIYKVIKL